MNVTSELQSLDTSFDGIGMILRLSLLNIKGIISNCWESFSLRNKLPHRRINVRLTRELSCCRWNYNCWAAVFSFNLHQPISSCSIEFLTCVITINQLKSKLEYQQWSDQRIGRLETSSSYWQRICFCICFYRVHLLSSPVHSTDMELEIPDLLSNSPAEKNPSNQNLFILLPSYSFLGNLKLGVYGHMQASIGGDEIWWGVREEIGNLLRKMVGHLNVNRNG